MPTQKISRGITRFDLDDRNSHGFMVRICRNKKHYNEFFSDEKFGNKTKAKKAAIARYQDLYEELGPAQKATKNKITVRNSTGKVGVHLATGVDSRWPNCEYSAYCASWVTEKGERQKINFSWNKYGKKKAWELACIARLNESNDRATVLKLFETKKDVKGKVATKTKGVAAKAKVTAKKMPAKKAAKK